MNFLQNKSYVTHFQINPAYLYSPFSMSPTYLSMKLLFTADTPIYSASDYDMIIVSPQYLIN